MVVCDTAPGSGPLSLDHVIFSRVREDNSESNTFRGKEEIYRPGAVLFLVRKNASY